MQFLKSFVTRKFPHFAFFYTHLRYRVFVALVLSLLVGTLDGFGLAMFLPLLQMVDGQSAASAENMGNLRFLVEGLEWMGVGLTLISVLLVMLVFFVLKGIAKFGEAYYRVILTRYFMRTLRFAHIDSLCDYSYKNFVSADVGRIQNTLSGEVERVLNAYRSYFMSIQAAVMVAVYVVLAFLANAQFAVLVVIGGGLSNLLYQRIYKRTKEASRRLTHDGHAFQGLLIQMVAFFKYLKGTGQARKYAANLKRTIAKIEMSSRKIGWYSAVLSSTKEPVVVLVVVGVIIVQVQYFSGGLGLIILSLLFFYRSLTFLMSLQTQWNTFLSVSGALENTTEFVRELKSGREKTGHETLERFNETLELRGVFCSYGRGNVLENINLAIKKNETIAFVGESGSGKTTLVNLLAGLMPVDRGVFSVDGKDVRRLKIDTYQRRIGYITQEPVIFDDNIFNNVTFWSAKTPENLERFWRALNRASIDSFVRGLPERENTILGNNGTLVSGGQKQRISIARELYKDIDILIMDEATSALDSETEKIIQSNIEKLKGQYTILIVAHRLATVRNADKVVFLRNKCVEIVSGSFEELKSRSRAFERMVELQEI